MRKLGFLLLALALVARFGTAQKGDLEQRVRDLESKILDRDAGARAGPADLRVYWKNALRLETADKRFRFKIGGRMHLDTVARLRDGEARDPGLQAVFDKEPRNRILFRRARLYLSGTLYEFVGFKFQYDFAGGDADFKDVYLELNNLCPVAKLRVGQFKEPFSLEELTSSNHISFMERSLANPFAPGRSTGFMLHDAVLEKRMTWAVGVFKDSDAYGSRDDKGPKNNWVFTGRVTGCPLYEDHGKTVLHVGLSGTHRNTNTGLVGFSARPEIRTKGKFVNTGKYAAEHVDSVGGEAAFVLGPFSAQAEYIQTAVDALDFRNVRYPAWYLEASFFVTGEHRRYDRKKAAFTRIKPAQNLGDDGGFGAVQLLARVSHVNLNKGPAARGGKMTDLTGGVNWYLNPNTRVMLNYVYTDRDRAEPWHFLGMRFQVDF